MLTTTAVAGMTSLECILNYFFFFFFLRLRFDAVIIKRRLLLYFMDNSHLY